MTALYQRKKSRDLFDLVVVPEHDKVDPARIVAASRDTWITAASVSRAEFEPYMEAKLRDREFNADIDPLLAPGYQWHTVPSNSLWACRRPPCSQTRYEGPNNGNWATAQPSSGTPVSISRASGCWLASPLADAAPVLAIERGAV
jgi:hypothetical protein